MAGQRGADGGPGAGGCEGRRRCRTLAVAGRVSSQSAFGMHVLMPSNPADQGSSSRPSVMTTRCCSSSTRRCSRSEGPVPRDDYVVPIGIAHVTQRGDDVTIVAWGSYVGRSLQAADRLSASGVEADVIDPRGIRPLDLPTILESVSKTGRLVLVHEAPRAGGPGGRSPRSWQNSSSTCWKRPWLASPCPTSTSHRASTSSVRCYQPSRTS